MGSCMSPSIHGRMQQTFVNMASHYPAPGNSILKPRSSFQTLARIMENRDGLSLASSARPSRAWSRHFLTKTPCAPSVFGKRRRRNDKSMPKTKASTHRDEMPTLTREDFARAVPFEKYPAAVKKAIAAQRKTSSKLPVAIPLSRDVLKALRATGSGWKERADDALRAWLAEHKEVSTASTAEERPAA